MVTASQSFIKKYGGIGSTSSTLFQTKPSQPQQGFSSKDQGFSSDENIAKQTNNKSKKKRVTYSGPVPQDANEQTFRETGITDIKPTATSTASTSATQVQSYIKEKQSQDRYSTFQQGQTASQLFGVSQASDPISSAYKKNIESQQQSKYIPTPSLQNIQTLIDEGKINSKDYSYVTKNIIEDYYRDAGQRDIDQATEFEKKKQEDFLETRREFYQGQIDTGSDVGKINEQYFAEIEKANKDLIQFQKDYAKQWEETSGKKILREGSIILGLTNLKGKYLDTKKKLPSFVGKGALVGVGTTVALTGLSAISAPISAPVGTVLATAGITYAGIEYFKAGSAGRKTYQQFTDLGFSKPKSFAFGLFGGATEIAPASFTALGGLGGSVASRGAINLARTGSLVGYTKTDIQNIKDISSRPNNLKLTEIKGGVKTSDIAIYKDGNVVSGTGGQSTKIYKVSLDPAGLTASQKASIAKFNLRGTFSQQASVVGKSLTGTETFNIKTGGLFGPTTRGISSIGGQLTGNNVIGFRTAYAQSGRTSTLSLERFTGTGKVTTDGAFRFETAKGFSERFAQFKFQRGSGFSIASQYESKFLGSDFTRVRTTGRINTLSKFTGGEITFDQGLSSLKVSKVYKDIAGAGRGGGVVEPMEFTRTTGGGAIKGFTSGSSGSGSAIQTIQTQQSSFVSSPATIQSSALVIKPITFTTQSPFYGTGQYEKTTENKMSSPRTSFSNLSLIKTNSLSNQVVTPSLSSIEGPPSTSSRNKTITGTLKITTPKTLQDTRLISKTTTTQLTTFPSPNFTLPPITPIGGFGVPFIPVPKPFGADMGGGLRDFKTRRTYKYTPSFGALVKGTPFKIGMTTSRRFTGLEFRGAKETTPNFLKGFLPKKRKRGKKK